MSEDPKPQYRVSMMVTFPDGRLGWQGILTTPDHEEANAQLDALKSDPEVKAKLEVILPRKKR
jgi:hypothetical protein